MNTRHVLLLILSTALLTACAPPIGQLKPFDTTIYGSFPVINGVTTLTLEVVTVDGTLILTVPGPLNPLCSTEERKWPGCLYIRRGYQADVGFKLDDSAISAGWVLTEFRICKGKKKPSSEEGCKTIKAERREWDASLTKDSDTLIHLDKNGIIDLTKLTDEPENLTGFVLHDQNSHRQNYFYNITACNGVDCINFDPPARNGGGK